MAAAFMSLGGALLTNIFLFYPILESALNLVINLIQIVILIVCVPLAYAFVKHMPIYEPDKPIEKISHNANLWEWFVFLSLITWIVALYINLLVL